MYDTHVNTYHVLSQACIQEAFLVTPYPEQTAAVK